MGSLAAVARELEEKVPHFPNPQNATIRRRLFVRSKGKATVGNVTIVDLEDLMNVPAA